MLLSGQKGFVKLLIKRLKLATSKEYCDECVAIENVIKCDWPSCNRFPIDTDGWIEDKNREDGDKSSTSELT